MVSRTLNKSERLKKNKQITELFEKGSSFYLFPFKVFTLPTEEREEPSHKFMVSIPKRLFKRAVDRNLLKRRIREAFRINKNLLGDGTFYHIAYIYTCKEILTYREIETKLIKTLERLISQTGA